VSDLHQQLRSLDVGLHVSVKNLRSQVVREACITISSVSSHSLNYTFKFCKLNLKDKGPCADNFDSIISAQRFVNMKKLTFEIDDL